MNYEEALKYIKGVSWLGVKPGLERVAALLERLGKPQEKLRFVHVAGTNGKGSACVLMATALSAAGYRTGLYTSPHLVRFNERMRLDGAEITDAELAAVMTELSEAAADLEDPCTEFELTTAAALLWFERRGADIVVLETGMGGRLDATNVIPCPECAVIMNIGLDHTAVLGPDVETIAAEKAGIFKGGEAVSYAQEPGVARALELAAERSGTRLSFADFSLIEPLSDSLEGQSFRFDGEEYSIRLLGEHQLKNAATALTALEALRERGWELPAEAVRRGFASAVWPARFELVSRSPLFVVDGGHNPQCVRATAGAIRRYMPCGRCVVLMGVLADKDWRTMLDLLSEVASGFVCATPDSERALSAAELGAEILRRGIHAEVCGSVEEAVEAARSMAGPEGAVCSVGSLYMSGAVRACFGLR